MFKIPAGQKAAANCVATSFFQTLQKTFESDDFIKDILTKAWNVPYGCVRKMQWKRLLFSI